MQVKVVHRKPRSERKEAELKIRFTKEQRRELDDAARAANDSTSSWIRREALEAARRFREARAK